MGMGASPLGSQNQTVTATTATGVPVGTSAAPTLSAGGAPTSGWSIFVYNLAPEVDDSTMWQLFGPFGAVLGVKVTFIET